jgi:hypothetical protein
VNADIALIQHWQWFTLRWLRVNFKNHPRVQLTPLLEPLGVVV